MHRLLALLFPALLAASPLAAAAGAPLRFHYPDTGAPPFLYLSPGAERPAGIVADVLEAAGRQAGRSVRYQFLPRERAPDAVRGNEVDGAMFFSVTRPAGSGITLSAPVLAMNSVLVTPRGRAIGFQKPADLADKRLCTLTDENYPPLTLLAMSGKFLQRKGKTEQAQLLMLRNDDCVAAIINGPTFQWLNGRYHWDDLRAEKQALLEEDLQLGFAPSEKAFADEVNATLRRLRASGELDRIVQRHLPGAANVSTR